MANLEYISDNIADPATVVYPSLKELPLTKLSETRQMVESCNWCRRNEISLSFEIDYRGLSPSELHASFPTLNRLATAKKYQVGAVLHTIRRQQIPSRATAAEASSSTSSANPTLDLPLSKLRTLCIIQMSDGDTDMWQYLQSLHSLTLDQLSNVETLLERLPHVTSLQELHISRCDCLSQITAWISDLKSLRKLSIRLCPSLTIPLDQIGPVTSLQNVEIEDCPKIVEL